MLQRKSAHLKRVKEAREAAIAFLIRLRQLQRFEGSFLPVRTPTNARGMHACCAQPSLTLFATACPWCARCNRAHPCRRRCHTHDWGTHHGCCEGQVRLGLVPVPVLVCETLGYLGSLLTFAIVAVVINVFSRFSACAPAAELLHCLCSALFGLSSVVDLQRGILNLCHKVSLSRALLSDTPAWTVTFATYSLL